MITLLVLCFIVGAAFLFDPALGIALSCFVAFYTIGGVCIYLRERSIARARPGENFDTFTKPLDLKRFDPEIIKDVYYTLQSCVSFPLRPSDDLWHELGMDWGEFDLDLVPELIDRANRVFDDDIDRTRLEAINTVLDLIEFLDTLPRA